MLKALVTKLFRQGTVWVLVGSSAVWGAYQAVKPSGWELTENQLMALANVAGQVNRWAGDLPQAAGRTTIVGFDRDPYGVVTDALRGAIWRSGTFDVLDFSTTEKVRRALDWTRRSVPTRQEAIDIAKRRHCDSAVWGRVDRLSDVGADGQLAVTVEVLDVNTGAALFVQTFDVQKQGDTMIGMAHDADSAGKRLSLMSCVLLWLVTAMVLPFIGWRPVERIVTGDSNAAILGLLVLLVFVDLSVAYVLLSLSVARDIGGVLLLAVFFMAVLWNYHALSLIKDRGQ